KYEATILDFRPSLLEPRSDDETTTSGHPFQTSTNNGGTCTDCMTHPDLAIYGGLLVESCFKPETLQLREVVETYYQVLRPSSRERRSQSV
ncbi:hypothetical protein AVEN_164665-1, partial [Araneus ventricosus]